MSSLLDIVKVTLNIISIFQRIIIVVEGKVLIYKTVILIQVQIHSLYLLHQLMNGH
ncbi:hypothetical protein KPC142_03697 [Klebsiella quasipneumoniae]|nr:hypothetical protein KPC142_03697 [Klebsiella quasipneumoniae]